MATDNVLEIKNLHTYFYTDGGVITMDILEEGDDEISRTLGFFISFVQQNGRMKTIKARNPWIFGALEDICEYCSVDLVYDPVEIMDQVIEEALAMAETELAYEEA